MAEMRRTGLALRAERAVLVQVVSTRDGYDADETFEELASLARTARAVVVGRLRQSRARPDQRYYVGKGKLAELRCQCRACEADVVICDDELAPAQVKALESELHVKVVDRSEVILDIFASHARTRQAKLQVELAQLEYELPRLARMWTHLDRTAGGTLGGPVGGGIGVRGPGEKQLEMDRRIVLRRVRDLRRALSKIERRRHIMVEGRKDKFPCVALVGYTNAGKSSLMNALTGAGVSVRDRLFETLDTRTRQWPLRGGRTVLLSDTVGFVRKFPHHLVASFHATLEEAREADLLLHVTDASRHDVDEEVKVVRDALAQVGCGEKPTLYVMNKVDLLQERHGLALVRQLLGDFACTSAVTGAGLDELEERVSRFLDEGLTDLCVTAAAENGRLAAFLHRRGRVLERALHDGVMQYRVRIDPECAGIISKLGGEVSGADARTGSA